MNITATAATAASHHHFLPNLRNIRQNLFGFVITNNGPDRHFHNGMLAILAVFTFVHAVFAALTFKVLLILERLQGVAGAVTHKDNVAAVAAIAAGRAAERHEFLPAKRHHTVAAGACFHMDFHIIIKHIFIFS